MASTAGGIRGAVIVAFLSGCGGGTSDAGKGLAPHDRFFVVGGSHATLTCDQCHDPAAPGFSLAEQGVSCTGCHTDAATTPSHAGVTGYSWSTASCLGCHKDGSGGLPANHDKDFFPVTGTKHAALGCAQCHGPTKAIADVTCTPCHAQAATATAHAQVPASKIGARDRITYLNYQWASGYCLKCHADGQVDRIASHPSVRHGITGSDHQPFCLTCHTALAPPGGKAWSANFGSYSCLACHSSNNP